MGRGEVQPKRNIRTLIDIDDLQPLSADGPGVRVWPDLGGNYWVYYTRHQICAALAHWVGWLPSDTVRQPFGVILEIFDLRMREDG